MNWANIGDPAASQGRTELVRYDSPSWNGFIFSASIAEAGDYWGTMLRYAGEFSGFRIAAGIGYENVTDKQTTAAANTNYDFAGRPSVEAWGGGVSLMHVPTGLFVQGHYNAVSFSEWIGNGRRGRAHPAAGGGCVSGLWGQTTTRKEDTTQWLVQGGIAKNWFGLGNTVGLRRVRQGHRLGCILDAAGRTYAAGTRATGTSGCQRGDRLRVDHLGPRRHPERGCRRQHLVPRLSAHGSRHHLSEHGRELRRCRLCSRYGEQAADGRHSRHRWWCSRTVLSRTFNLRKTGRSVA